MSCTDSLSIKFSCPIVPYVRMTQRGKWSSPAAQRYMANQEELRWHMRTAQTLPPRTPLKFYAVICVPMAVGHRCDLDNLVKALLDAANGVLFEDDRWVDAIYAERMVGRDWQIWMEVEAKIK